VVNRQRRKFLQSGLYASVFFVTGCALPPTAQNSNQELSTWRGRLAVRVVADGADRPAQSVSAGFELTGNAGRGGLTLYTPIGGTAAVLTWSKHDASVMSKSEVRHFPSLNELMDQVLGTSIPVEALFAWLAGTNASANGWIADLTGHADGRITAQRTTPHPPAELRIVLER
jgi:outer membrane lipoprotein LolB